MAKTVLELKGVTKDYGQRVITRVLHGIDLRIEQGEFAALIGPSGSGKSTLLNIMGLLDRPTQGQVLLGGTDTAALSEGQRTQLRGRTLGFVFQFHHLLAAFSAQENVLLPLYADRGRADGQMRRWALELLQKVGLEDQAKKKASDLSGGQQQRVAIARALVMNPSLVLADEPTGNLDTHTADQIFALLRQFNEKAATSFLVVTHDPRLASRCDRIIELVDGKVFSDHPHPSSGSSLAIASTD